MMNRAPLSFGPLTDAIGDQAPDRPDAGPATDHAWREHGWGLGASAVGGVVAAVLAVACAVQLLG